MPAPPEQPAEPAPRPPDREAPEGEGPAPASAGQPAPWMPAPEPQQLLHPRQVSAPSALEPGAAAPAPLAGAKAFGRLWHIHHCILISDHSSLHTHHCTLVNPTGTEDTPSARICQGKVPYFMRSLIQTPIQTFV